MEQLTCKRLKDDLIQLKMAHPVEILDVVLARAKEEKMSYRALLDRIMENQVSPRDGGRCVTAITTLPSTFIWIKGW
jgi:hypothetical protein